MGGEQGRAGLKWLLIFVPAPLFMRAAGCVINDYADRHFDGHVAYQGTPAGRWTIRPREALILFAVLVALSFVLVLFTNLTTILLSFGGPGCLAPSGPLHLHPQVVRAAFSWGACRWPR